MMMVGSGFEGKPVTHARGYWFEYWLEDDTWSATTFLVLVLQWELMLVRKACLFCKVMGMWVTR